MATSRFCSTLRVTFLALTVTAFSFADISWGQTLPSADNDVSRAPRTDRVQTNVDDDEGMDWGLLGLLGLIGLAGLKRRDDDHVRTTTHPSRNV